jgi:hypothetical protein
MEGMGLKGRMGMRLHLRTELYRTVLAARLGGCLGARDRCIFAGRFRGRFARCCTVLDQIRTPTCYK